MTFFYTNVLIGLALSMDAMSLSFIYGTMKITKKKSIILSITVGVYHFFMPIIGSVIGNALSAKFMVYHHLILGVIFLFLSLQMLISIKKEEPIKMLLSPITYLLFALSVSLDSLSVGVGLGLMNKNIVLSGIVFSTISCGLTYLGIQIGRFFHKNCGKTSLVIGFVLLLFLSLYYFFT